jgi:hypothetical protein
VVQTASGEETAVGSPGGVEYGEVVFRSRRREELGLECSICGEYVFRPDHPEPDMKHFAFHLKSEHKDEIGPGASYESYVVDDDESDRSGAGSDRSGDGPGRSGGVESAAADEPELSERDRRRVDELVRTEGVESVPAILGRLGMDPSQREAVGRVVARRNHADDPGEQPGEALSE